MRHMATLTLAILIAASAAVESAGAQTFEEALAQAYSSNPRLLSERAALRAVDEGVPRAKSGWRPTVQINGSVGTRYSSNEAGSTGNVSSENTTPASAGLNLSQPLWRGGATAAETEAAENRVLSGRANLIDSEQQILVASATAYMNVVRDQSVVELNINNEQVLGRQLQAARDRFEVGEVTRTDVSQAEARLSEAAASRIEVEGLLQLSRASYESLIGGVPGLLMFPDLTETIQLPPTDGAARSLALQRNPTIQRAGFNERAALHDISAAGASLLPQITLDGSLQRSWDPNSFFAELDNASLIANVTVPLYQSGAEYARVRELRHIAVQRRRELDAARRTAVETVAGNWARLVTAQARIRAFESAVRANEIALDGVQQEAAVGARTVLDVLDAEQELFDARVNLVGAQTNEVIAAFELLSVVGGMTARGLRLPTALYDPVEHYNEVRDKWIGFGSDYQADDSLFGLDLE